MILLEQETFFHLRELALWNRIEQEEREVELLIHGQEYLCILGIVLIEWKSNLYPLIFLNFHMTMKYEMVQEY